MCAIEMSSVLDETIRPYKNDKCGGYTKSTESHNFSLDISLPLELKGSGFSYFLGFKTKQDNGDIRAWGRNPHNFNSNWTVIGGPVIGFFMRTESIWIKYFGLIVGDSCRPKYFGSRKLVV